VYDVAMAAYQAPKAFDFFLTSAETKHASIEFKKMTIESFVYDSILVPILETFNSKS
jgi:hypothetical protein